MSIVKINTLDRTLIVHEENSSEEFVTHLNVYGKFIFIDSKFDRYFLAVLFSHRYFYFPELGNTLVTAHLN